MNYILVLIALFLVGCSDNALNTPDGLPGSIGKFRDGNVICYTYFQHAMSCVVMEDGNEVPQDSN